MLTRSRRQLDTVANATPGLARRTEANDEARRLVVMLLVARLEEGRSGASARLLPIAARLANATLEPRRRLATPHLLRLLLCLDELESAARIDFDLASELWRVAARVHRALQHQSGISSVAAPSATLSDD